MRQDVEHAKASDDRLGGFFRGGQTVEQSGHRGELWIIDVGLPEVRRESNHGKIGVQRGFRACVPRPPLAPVTMEVFSDS